MILCVPNGKTKSKVITLKITVSQIIEERDHIISQVDHVALVVVVIAATPDNVAIAVAKTAVVSEAATTVEAAAGQQQGAAAEADRADVIGSRREINFSFSLLYIFIEITPSIKHGYVQVICHVLCICSIGYCLFNVGKYDRDE